MHRWIYVSPLAIGLTAGGIPTAYAHSWYPKECCSQNDCAPADRIEMGPRGITAVMVQSANRNSTWLRRPLIPRQSYPRLLCQFARSRGALDASLSVRSWTGVTW